LTTMRSGPRDSAISRAFATAASSVTLPAANRTRSPRPASSSSPLRSRATTCAPASSNRFVVANPNPEVPPVTTATASVISTCSLSCRRDSRRAYVVKAQLPSGETAADHHALDLVGPLEDLHDFGLAHVALDAVVACVPRAAEYLHGVGGDFHRGVGGN